MDIQIINQKSDLDRFLILDLQKRYVNLIKDFLRGDKEKNDKKSTCGRLLEGIKDQAF